MTEQAQRRPRRHWVTWLVNPFHFVAGGQALGAGLAAIVVAGLVASVSDSHFDGVLDFHTGLAAPFWLPVAEGLIDWLVLGVLLFLAGLVLSRTKFRAVDVFGTQALARWPTLLMALAALLPGYRQQSARFAAFDFSLVPAYAPEFFTTLLVVFIAILWMVVLMYRAFAVSCNVSGGRAIGLFVFALIVGEVASKVALYLVLQATGVAVGPVP